NVYESCFFKFDECDFGQDSYPARVSQYPITPINVEVLVFSLIQSRPFFINILGRTPSDDARDFHAKLKTVGVSGKGEMNILIIGRHLSVPVRGIVGQ